MSRETTRSYAALVTTRNEGEIEGAFGDFGSVKTEPTTPESKRKSLQVIHAGLTKLVFIRRAVEDALADGRTITLVQGVDLGYGGRDKQGNPTSADGKRWWFQITPPIDLNEASPWARPPQDQTMQDSMGLFSRKNSKMQCPSFAIPAGAREIGGSCVGAGAAQTVVPEETRLKHAAAVGEPVHVANAVCGYCYSSVGTSFQHGTVQLQEVTRFWWLDAFLKQNPGREGVRKLAQVLITGLEGEMAAGWKIEEHGGRKYRFFRLHDSGDFFSTRYAEAWIEVARALPEVHFWAPTRTWAAESFRKFWAETDVPENLIIRPSAYHFNDAAPRFEDQPALAAGTTSLYAVCDEQGVDARGNCIKKVEVAPDGRADWNCQVYRAGKGAHSCVAAHRPVSADDASVSSETGCRACWLFPKMTVNYTAHGLLFVATLLGLFA